MFTKLLFDLGLGDVIHIRVIEKSDPLKNVRNQPDWGIRQPHAMQAESSHCIIAPTLSEIEANPKNVDRCLWVWLS
jgi:hypothetical protein